jgi:hypothetical protein
MLDNDVCDTACNTQDCIYDNWSCVNPTQTCAEECLDDKLGNGSCEYACNTTACGFDHGDCGVCSEGCTYAKWSNGSCDAACNNAACAYDDYDCVRTRQLCAPGCTEALLTNDQCDSACNVKACNFDSKLCVSPTQNCTEGCDWIDVGDGLCDAECDTAACDKDGGDCVILSQGCTEGCDQAMIGDGTCQPACYNEACKWDKTDCSSRNCSPECTPTLQFNTACDQECNSAPCNYDEGSCRVCSSDCCDKIGECKADCLIAENGYDVGCADNFKRDTAKFFQTYFEDYSLVTGPDTCYSKDADCNEAKLREFYAGTGTDATACTSDECLNQLGQGQVCAVDCKRCNGSKCLECKDPYCQHYSTCVTACPSGFIEHPKVPKLCYPSGDIESLPAEIFISETETGPNYYSNLGYALNFCNCNYAVIYLTDAVTVIDGTYFSNSAKSLKITTNLCSLDLGTPCLNHNAMVRVFSVIKFATEGKLIIENVDFDGRNILDNSCAEDFCSYVPYYLQVSDVYIDDRDKRYTLWPGEYYSWHTTETPFISTTTCGSSLILINVAFNNFRINYEGLVFGRGRIHLKGVTFSNVNSLERFVIQQDCCAGSQCDFKYVGGSAELVNNGYEYRDDLIQYGFMWLKNPDSVYIKDVEFRDNIAIKSYKLTNDSNQHILRFYKVKGLTTIENCTFKTSVITGIVIYLDNKDLVPLSQTANNKERILDETMQNHVTIKNCVFIDLSALGLIKIEIGTQMLNVQLEGLVIEHSVAEESLIEVTRTSATSVFDVEGGYDIKNLENTQGSTGVKFLPRHSRLSAVTINNSSWVNYAFKFVNLVDLTIDKISISQSGSFEGDINTFTANALMLNPKVYLRRPVDFGYSNATCLAGISVQGTYGLKISRIELSDMKCQGCAGLVANQIYKSVTVRDFKAVRVKSSSSQAALLSLTEIEGPVTITGVNADTVTNLFGSGVVYSRLTSLTLTDSTLKNVVASQSPGLYLPSMKSITVSNVVFQSLQSISGLGAGIQASFDARDDVYFNLKSSNFTECASASRGGGVAMTYSTKPLAFLLDDCEFSSNNAGSGGSSLYIESTVVFTANSKISNSKFFKNTDLSEGTLSIKLATPLRIEGCEFYDNTSKEDVLFVALPSTISALSLNNSRLYSNTSNAVLNVRGSGQTSLLTLTSSQLYKNKAVSTVLLKKCTVSGDALSLTENTGPLTMLTAYSSLVNSSFTQNSSKKQSGAVELFDSSSFSCSKCMFKGNSAVSAGAIRVDSNSVIMLLDCSILENSASESGSALYLINSREANLIENSSITSNTAGSSTILLIESKLALKTCTFSDNAALSIPGIGAQKSDIIIENSLMASQKSTDAVFFDLQAFSTASFLKTNFRYGKSVNGGAVGKMQSSSAVFIDCSFDNINSGQGSAVEASSSPILISNLTATNITSDAQGALLKMTSSRLELNSSSLIEFNQTALSLTDMETVLIKDCTFERGTAPAETVLKAVNFNKVTVSGSVFSNNQANTQVATLSLKVLSTWESSSSLEVSRSTFKHNSAPLNGCIKTDVKTVLIANSTFFNNSALSGSAGALQLDCIESAPCNFTVTSNNFSSNSAGLDGGAVYWTKQQPTFLNNSFSNNSAEYGPDVASFGIKMKSLDFDESQGKLSKVSEDSYIDIASGQRLPQPIVIALVDHTGQVVKTDNSSTASIFPKDTANMTVTGNSKVTAVRGVYTFTEVKFSAQPGVSIKALFSSDVLDALTSQVSGYSTEPLSVDMQLRECQTGEALVGKDCVQCIAGTYSLDSTQPCTNCPSGAKCLGGSLILPDSGYWRPSKYTDSVFACPNSAACLGSSHIKPSLTGECHKGYRGNKCQACDNGYSRTAEDVCGKCPDEVSSAFRLIGMLTILALICGGLVWSSLHTAYESAAVSSIYLKIFVNYLQLVLLTTQLRLEWPSFVYELFSIQSSAGTLSNQFLNVDCYLGDSSNDDAYKDLYFDKIKIIALIPVIFSLAATAFWTVHFSVRRDKGVFRRQWVATLVVLFFLIHPNILRSNFSYFSCTEIQSGEFWLNENLDIRCFDSKHNSFALVVVLPVLVIWGLLVPILVLLYLVRNRRELSEINMKLRFGFLYNGFKQSKFYWEFVIMFRKILIICIVVFSGNQSIPIQALTLVLLLLNFLVLQYLTRPYANTELNQMEFRSVFVASVTIFCGLYYLTKDLGDVAKVLFFLVMLLANLYFLSYFTSNLFRAMAGKLANLHPLLRRILRQPLPNPYPGVRAQEPPVSRQSVMISDEMSYTLVPMVRRQPPTLPIRELRALCITLTREMMRRDDRESVYMV